MSKDHIEEMASVLDEAKIDARATIGSMNYGFGMWYAKALYNAGYRRQSEWISVDERLPEEGVRVLVWLKCDGSQYTSTDTDRLSLKKWVRWGRLVTHWMPLPEAPKMKGGAE